ncbi:MAG: ATP-binding protein [Marvinbryantia sp.]
MKKLMRMKLINWHRFEDCMIDFGDSTLISGENGAGKSTLLDAIQFVVTCSSNSFNKAAHENGKRKLTGYVRCKTGRESKPYERTGQITAHIALEFYEESKERYFIVGAVVDSAAEGQETTVRYLIDNKRMTDDMFLKGNAPRSISEFRIANKSIRQWCKTQIEAKKMIKSRFGRIDDKFFSLIPKALAFKPIDDIKDFVYSYVLDEKEVNIEVLRENVRTYQDLERTLANVKKRMEKLERIDKFHRDVKECIRKDRMYEFYLSQVEVDISKEKIQRLEDNVRAEKYRGQEIQKNLEAILKEKEQKLQLETNLRLELKQNKDYIALEEQEKEQVRLKEEEKQALLEKKELLDSVKKAIYKVHRLLEVKDVSSCVRKYGDIEKLYAYLRRTPKGDYIVQHLQLLDSWKQKEEECFVVWKFIDYLKERIQEGKTVKEFIDLPDLEKTKRILTALSCVEKNRESCYIREFSIRQFADSKVFEGLFGVLGKIMRRFRIEFADMDIYQILAEYNIYHTPDYVYLKGEGILDFQNGMESRVNLAYLEQGLGISGADIENVRISGKVKKVITIENLTTFFRWQEKNSLMIYLGGYHNSVRRELLRRVYQVLPDAKYLHFGDIDVGGFEIYRDLCEKTEIPFQTYHMGISELQYYQEYTKKLTENDQKRLNSLMEKEWFCQKEMVQVLQYMKKKGVKLEQEIVRDFQS